MTRVSPIASSAILRQIDALGVRCGFARALIILQYSPRFLKSLAVVVLHEMYRIVVEQRVLAPGAR